jgi:hypothetical protein
MIIEVYKITNNIDDEIFIGAAKNMSRKFGNYKRFYRKLGPTSKLYKHFEKHGTQAFRVELIETIYCKTKIDIKNKRREYIRLLNPSLNSYTLLTDVEKKQRARQLKEQNKDKIKAKNRVKETCMCGRVYTVGNKTRHMKTRKHLFWQQLYEFIYS